MQKIPCLCMWLTEPLSSLCVFLLHNVSVTKTTLGCLRANVDVKAFFFKSGDLAEDLGSVLLGPDGSHLYSPWGHILGRHTTPGSFSITSLNQVLFQKHLWCARFDLSLAPASWVLPACCLGKDGTKEAIKTTTHIVCKYSLPHSLIFLFSLFNWFTSSVISKWMHSVLLNRKKKSVRLSKLSCWKSAVKQLSAENNKCSLK